jgi:hypothetical protein
MNPALHLIFTSENITDASWVSFQTDFQRFAGNEEMQSSNSSAASAPESKRKALLSEISASAHSKTPPVTIEEIDLTSASQPAPGLALKGPAPPLPTPPSSLPATDNTHASRPDKAQVLLALLSKRMELIRRRTRARTSKRPARQHTDALLVINKAGFLLSSRSH